MPFPLLALPGELRMRIYHFVLGNNCLHFETAINSADQVIPHVCLAQPIYHPRNTFEQWESGRLTTPACDMDSSCTGSDPRKRKRLSLNLLRTCKRVYEEARRIPFEANIFAFDIDGVYKKPCIKQLGWRNRPLVQHLAKIRCLALVLTAGGEVPASLLGWLFCVEPLKNMTGLHSVLAICKPKGYYTPIEPPKVDAVHVIEDVIARLSKENVASAVLGASNELRFKLQIFPGLLDARNGRWGHSANILDIEQVFNIDDSNGIKYVIVRDLNKQIESYTVPYVPREDLEQGLLKRSFGWAA